MALEQFYCLNCEKNFKAGNWTCVNGMNHSVANKRYFMNDAPSVVSIVNGRPTVNKRDSATQIQNIPPEKRVIGPDGNERIIPGGQVQFIRGMYETTNPEEQFWLNQHRGMCDEKTWQDAYLNEDEKLQLERMELAAERTRLEGMKNDLLSKVQAQG